MHLVKLVTALLILLVLVLGAGLARAETVGCTPITALPAVITTQGIYCFTGHLSTNIMAGFAIDIQTSNVVLDLNAFKLGGLAGGPATQAIGIHALNRQNITIKNGTVRGFLRGIQLETSGTSQGHVVDGIRADQNTAVGIEVAGAGNIVRNNQVVATAASLLPQRTELRSHDLAVGDLPREDTHVAREPIHAGHECLRDRWVVIWQVTADQFSDQRRFGWWEELAADLGGAGDVLP